MSSLNKSMMAGVILYTSGGLLSTEAHALGLSDLQCLQVLGNTGISTAITNKVGISGAMTSQYNIPSGNVINMNSVVNNGNASYRNFMVAYDRNIAIKNNTTGTIYNTTATYDLKSDLFTPYSYISGGWYFFGFTNYSPSINIFCSQDVTYQPPMTGTITFTLPAILPVGTYTVTIPARKIFVSSNQDILTITEVQPLLNSWGITYNETLDLTLTNTCHVQTPDISVAFSSIGPDDLRGGLTKNAAFSMSCDAPLTASLRLTHGLENTNGSAYQLRDPVLNLTTTVGFVPSTGTVSWNNGTYTMNMSSATLNATLPVTLSTTDSTRPVVAGDVDYTIVGVLSFQ
ncbi:hypothetical protein K3J84_003681 [Salmonella enterica]|nr:hypothetical protein [Salmonella enterica subsp. enterica serovar Oslo]EHW8352140.1 hypothetical protein [Salmonella enterica]